MRTILIKEFRGFFGNATGILIIGIFLIGSGLFLWLIPGEYNILDSGYSSLSGLFELSPWLFLFLASGITMRMFADEKKMGTIELLYTYPITKYELILGKYLASFLLGITALLPTLIYYFSVYKMGEPVGNIDTGGTWGSYIGLILIFSSFSAIGIFSSTLSQNSLVAFIISATLCFLMYIGFDLLSSLFSSGHTQSQLQQWGIFKHYQSISRGVLDSQDIAYFLAICILFLSCSGLALSINSPINKFRFFKGLLLLSSILIALTAFTQYKLFRVDMTLEKRYTLADPTKTLLKSLDGDIVIDVYLEGDLNAGFNHLKESISDLVSECSYYSNHLNIHFYDPNTLTSSSDGRSLGEVLESKGMKGVQVNLKKKDGSTIQKVVYPWLSITYKGKSRKVNILNNNPSNSGYENLNSSTQDLEYKITDALRTLQNTKEEAIAFLEGHGEYNEMEVEDISRSLSEYYRIDRGTITNQIGILDPYKLVITAGPIKEFSDVERYILDQYVMNGGKILWLIDGTNMTLDSLNEKATTYSFPNKLNLEDQLFQYGARINANLIEDVQCVKIPVNISSDGESPNFTPMPWYFSPLLFPYSDNVIGKNVGPVKGNFTSSISLVNKNSKVKKTVLMSSSNYSKTHTAPSPIDLRMSNRGIDSSYFNERSLPVAVLLEGRFNSAFKNTLPPEGVINTSHFIKESKPTKMILISDADIIRNDIQNDGGIPSPTPLGYDKYLNQNFSNKIFLLNAINYLCDDEDWMELRARNIELRLLSPRSSIQERVFWQKINLIIPISILLMGSILFILLKKK